MITIILILQIVQTFTLSLLVARVFLLCDWRHADNEKFCHMERKIIISNQYAAQTLQDIQKIILGLPKKRKRKEVSV